MTRGPLNELGDEICAMTNGTSWEDLGNVRNAFRLIEFEAMQVLRSSPACLKTILESDVATILVASLACARAQNVDVDKQVAETLAFCREGVAIEKARRPRAATETAGETTTNEEVKR